MKEARWTLSADQNKDACEESNRKSQRRMRRTTSGAAAATGKEAAVSHETGRAITLACVLCDKVNHYGCGMEEPRLAGSHMIRNGCVFSQKAASGLLEP